MKIVFRKEAHQWFQDGDDRARVVISGDDTNGTYSTMEWRIAPVRAPSKPEEGSFGTHLHRKFEETFLIISGTLEFLIDGQIVVLDEGDFVRVPKGILHGYRNVSDRFVIVIVSFAPAGLEQLFVKYRTDQPSVPEPGFIAEATRDHASEFEATSA